MVEFVFHPPNVILFLAIGIVAVSVVSVVLKKGSRSRKVIALAIVVAVAGVLLLAFYRPTTLTVDSDGVRTNGLRGVALTWADVEHAYFETNLRTSEYRPTVRTNGAAIGDFRTGRFLLSNGESAQVLMERSDQAVVLVTAERTYLFAPSRIDLLVDAINRYRPLPVSGAAGAAAFRAVCSCADRRDNGAFSRGT